MSYGADLNARTNDGQLPIDLARSEEIKQAIRDEPRRHMDEAPPGKRATEQDRHPIDEGAIAAEEETKVAEEDEDSEPSSDEEEDDLGVRNSTS